MKRISFIFLLTITTIASYSSSFDFSGTKFKSIGGKEGSAVDSVLLIKGSSDIKMIFNSDDEYKFTWKTYDAEGNVTNLKTYDTPTKTPDLDIAKLEGSAAYILDFGVVGKSGNDSILDIWVFDVEQYKAKIDTVYVDEDLSDQCEFLMLVIDGSEVVPMQYKGYKGTSGLFDVDQKFVISYDSTYFSNKEYVTEEKSYAINGYKEFVIPVPLASTFIKVMATDVSMAVGDTLVKQTIEYKPIAVEIHAFASVRIREDAINEKDRGEPVEPKENPEGVVLLKGSAPLNVEVLDYASEGAFHYTWVLSSTKDYKQIIVKTYDKDFRFEFKEKGTYYLKTDVSNGTLDEEVSGCTKTRQFQIDVYDSSLEVPNVFTPNGDGINDEFKVAYRSLIEFHGWIYNQWGRLVYEWTDPAQGWDGKLNSQDAPDGTYIYIIEATGDDYDSDGKRVKYRKKGTVSIIR